MDLTNNKSSTPLNKAEYCKICKQTFDNWEAFHLHKVQSEIHNTCLVCSQDFKSDDCRLRHQRQEHPAEQNLRCVGCHMKFTRISGYISHIENRQCEVIKKEALEKRRAALEKELARPSFSTSTDDKAAFYEPPLPNSIVTLTPPPETQATSGFNHSGVTTGHDTNEIPRISAQHSYQPVIAGQATNAVIYAIVDAAHQNTTADQDVLWTGTINEALGMNNTGSPWSPTFKPYGRPEQRYELAHEAPEETIDVDGDDSVNFDDPPTLGDGWDVFNDPLDNHGPILPMYPILLIDKPQHHTQSHSDDELPQGGYSEFSQISSTMTLAPPRDISSIHEDGMEFFRRKGLAALMEEHSIQNPPASSFPTVKKQDGNISEDTTSFSLEEVVAKIALEMPSREEYRQHDPDRPGFNAEHHKNPYTGKYRCPWPRCTKSLKTARSLYMHLKSLDHRAEKLRCRKCLRLFGSVTSLVQHTEAQSYRCDIRDSTDFKKAVEKITGGLVTADGHHQDKTVRYLASSEYVPRNGAASFGAVTDYTAASPPVADKSPGFSVAQSSW